MSVRKVSAYELKDYTNEATPNRPVVIYCYEEGTPVHSSILQPAFVEISRKASIVNQFLSIDADEIGDDLMAALDISSFPSFVVHKGSSVEPATFSVQTRERLFSNMANAGIIEDK
jgi:hypothetical protein